MESSVDLMLGLPDHLGRHMKSLRKLRGMSQGELGARLGVTQSRVAQIEAQPGAVSLDQILRVLQVLGAELLVRAPDVGGMAGAAAPALGGTPVPDRQRGDAPQSTAPVLFREARKGSW